MSLSLSTFIEDNLTKEKVIETEDMTADWYIVLERVLNKIHVDGKVLIQFGGVFWEFSFPRQSIS